MAAHSRFFNFSLPLLYNALKGNTMVSRRSFVRNAGSAAIVYRFVESGPYLKAAGPNGQVGMGFIGIGIRGMYLLEAFKGVPGVKPLVACDVYDGHLERAKEVAPGIETTRDYQSVLKRSDIDAVVIATPDHWHHRMVLDALEERKHVYVEKPMTWNIEQGKDIVAATQKSGMVVMVGAHGKTTAQVAKAREIVKSGILGKVNMVRMENNRNTPEGAWVYPVPPDASPQTIDWARFLGNAPKRPFSPEVFFRWRCWWEYSGGVATDLFVHLLTSLHEIMDVTAPKSAVSQGGLYRWDDGRTVPDVMNTIYEYPENFIADMYVNLGNAHGLHGTVFKGSEGTMLLPERGPMSGGIIVYPEAKPAPAQRYAVACWPEKMRAEYYEALGYTADGRPKTPLPPTPSAQEIKVERGPQHHEYFIMSIRDGSPSKESAAEGHYAAAGAHLANLAYRRGRRMQWDPKTGKVSEG
jgi:predicted dehydrogenase